MKKTDNESVGNESVVETPPAAKLPVHDWAKKKGHVAPAPQKRPQHTRTTGAWVFNATRGREGWRTGHEVTEAEYDAAVARTFAT